MMGQWMGVFDCIILLCSFVALQSCIQGVGASNTSLCRQHVQLPGSQDVGTAVSSHAPYACFHKDGGRFKEIDLQWAIGGAEASDGGLKSTSTSWLGWL